MIAFKLASNLGSNCLGVILLSSIKPQGLGGKFSWKIKTIEDLKNTVFHSAFRYEIITKMNFPIYLELLKAMGVKEKNEKDAKKTLLIMSR